MQEKKVGDSTATSVNSIEEALVVLEAESVEQLLVQLKQQTLDESYQKIYAQRETRELHNLLVRSLGRWDDTSKKIVLTYEDRGKTKLAELGEFDAEMQKYDEGDRSLSRRAKIALEAADIVFFFNALNHRPKDIEENALNIARDLFAREIEGRIKPGLAKAGIEYSTVLIISRLKYGVRANLTEKGKKGKFDPLEESLAVIAIKEQDAQKEGRTPKDVAAWVGYSSVEEYNEFLQDFIAQENILPTLVRRKYGLPLDQTEVGPVDYRESRQIFGEKSIAARVWGITTVTDSVSLTTSGGATDYGQYIEVKQLLLAAIRQRDKEKYQHITIELIRRATSFLWQRTILQHQHTASIEKALLLALFDNFIQHEIKPTLAKLGIHDELYQQLTAGIFASRLFVEKEVLLERLLVEKMLRRQGRES